VGSSNASARFVGSFEQEIDILPPPRNLVPDERMSEVPRKVAQRGCGRLPSADAAAAANDAVVEDGRPSAEVSWRRRDRRQWRT
jgi:hypothetical protein